MAAADGRADPAKSIVWSEASRRASATTASEPRDHRGRRYQRPELAGDRKDRSPAGVVLGRTTVLSCRPGRRGGHR